MDNEVECEKNVEIIRLLNIYRSKIGLIYEECHDSKNLCALLTVMMEFSCLIGSSAKIPKEEFINSINKYFEERNKYRGK
jgi:hypothetical protein